MRSWRCILFLVILHFKQIASDGDLPIGAKIVDKCPEPMNRTAWEMASKRLGCAHSGKISSEQNQVYHCLPSSLLNEYIEFCGITAPIDQGNCPVFRYVNTTGRNRSPTSWNCSKFSSGCPSEFYYSRDVYKHPECLHLDRSHSCFRADTSCMIDLYLTSTIEYNTGIMYQNDGQNRSIFKVVLGLLISTVMVICVLVGIIFKLICPLKGRKDRKKITLKGERYQPASLLLKDEDPEKKHQVEGEGEGYQQASLLLKDQNPEKKHQVEETSFNEISVSPVARLLCQIAEKLPSEKIAKLKFLFKANYEENAKEENEEISTLDRYELFQYMHRFYDFNLNLYILMCYLETIQEGKLRKICEEFAKSADHPLNYYIRDGGDRGDTGYTKVYLKVAMDIKTYNRQDLINIVKNVQKLLACKHDDIFVRGISEGCILLHLDLKSTLIETFRRCDFTTMGKHNVFKITIMEECIFYCPDLDDKFHEKKGFKTREFIGSMLYCLGFFTGTSMKRDKICRTGRQPRIRSEMCNKQPSIRKTEESVNTERLESSKECLEDVLTGESNTESKSSLGEDPEQHTIPHRRVNERNSISKENSEDKIMHPESTKEQGETNIDENAKKHKQEKICLKEDTHMQGKLDVKEETEMQLDELHRISDFRNVCSYDCFQEDLFQVIKSINTIVDLPAFHCHIQQDLHKLHDINQKIKMMMHNEVMTDRTIVVAGETSFGKSTIINSIMGGNIMPTDIMAPTTRICRIRYSEKMRVSILNKEGKEFIQSDFYAEKQLIEMMKDLATTNDHQIEYIDVWFPAPILKGNRMIVDTPGNGDTEQDYVAKMMEYLPNAVAFIFVVNVPSASGFQDNSFLHMLTRVKEYTTQMCCFHPEDVIFLINKWDAVSQKRDLYEELKDKVHEIWEDVNDTNILNFASAKIHEEEAHTVKFDKFMEKLKDVIAKNELKRMQVHLGFLKTFVDLCEVSLSSKLRCARQSAEETFKEFDQLCRDLQLVTKKRLEAFSSLQHSVYQFLEETTEDLYQYIHSSEFKSLVLQGIEKYKRFTIGKELDTRIEKANLSWQKENIGKLFERKIVKNLTDNFVRIHESLHKIKSKMKGFTSPFDVEDKFGSVLVSLIALSGTAVAGSMAMKYMSVSPRAASAVAAAGVVTGPVFTGLVALDVLDDFETVTENAYKARIDKITKEKISQMLHKTYAERFKNVIKSYLEGDLQREIEDLSASIISTKSKIDFYKTEESSLLGLSSEISEIRNRLEEFKNIEIKLD